MRKTIIALMLILPLLFVFIIFSSVNIVSLGVNISVNGISILNKSDFANDTLRIDMANPNTENKLEVAVLPGNATNKGYTFRVDEVEGSKFANVSIDDNGAITAKSEGAARVSAVSNDGGYRDSITVIVGSSKPYDFDFSMMADGNSIALMTDENGNYFAEVETGWFTYNTKIYPSGFTSAKLEPYSDSDIAKVEAGKRSVLLPFSGETVLKVVVEDGINGEIVKTVTLKADKRTTPTGITVNGEQGSIIALEKGAKSVSFFVEAAEKPSLIGNEFSNVSVEEIEGREGCFIVNATLNEGIDDDFNASLNGVELLFTFEDFDFSLASDMTIKESNGKMSTSMLRGIPVTFYAVAAVPGSDINYRWGVDNSTDPDGLDSDILSTSTDGATCTVNAGVSGDFLLWVSAYRGNTYLGLDKEVFVSVISPVSNLQITNNPSTDLAARFTIGGKKYDGSDLVENKYLLDVKAYDATGADSEAVVDDFYYEVSDPSKADLSIDGDKFYVVPRGTGEVTISVRWKGNDMFDANCSASFTLNVVYNGVEVANAPDLIKATGEGREVVLTSDIMLGTDRSGNKLPLETRKNMLGRMKSTYNIEWYKKSGKEKDAYVNYVLEFKDDVYGNGHSINAEYFTNSLDGSNGMPEIFRGPRYFVSLGELASVAGQDNIAFLIRNDDVTLYGVNLLGCSDESLMNDAGEYDLTKLNKVGTVLDVNADAQIVNCRIRNGRNVIRIYGGNRDGNKYFIDSLAENVGGVDNERINVTIEGCIISQGREFLIKTGANRALRASSNTGEEPSLVDKNNKAYGNQTNKYLDDSYFYQMYVMTDLTVRDCVLETSGLFAIGVESNFAGSMLYSDSDDGEAGGFDISAWHGTGGTSFATILRLEGDVRIYDWKDISLVDSSTLIETSSSSELPDMLKNMFKLDIAAMIDFVKGKNPNEYGNIITDIGGKKFVHGGIAFYGGGNNYSQISLSGLESSLADLSEYKINISVLEDSNDSNLRLQGQLLPNAAGHKDFRFYMYGADSANSYNKQLSDAASGKKYDGIKALNVL